MVVLFYYYFDFLIASAVFKKKKIRTIPWYLLFTFKVFNSWQQSYITVALADFFIKLFSNSPLVWQMEWVVFMIIV